MKRPSKVWQLGSMPRLLERKIVGPSTFGRWPEGLGLLYQAHKKPGGSRDSTQWKRQRTGRRATNQGSRRSWYRPEPGAAPLGGDCLELRLAVCPRRAGPVIKPLGSAT